MDIFFYHSKYICINFQNIIGPFIGSINRYPKTERNEGHKFLYEKPSLACQVLIIRIYKLFHKSFKFINSLSLHLVPDAKWGKKPKNATIIICLIFVRSYLCLRALLVLYTWTTCKCIQGGVSHRYIIQDDYHPPGVVPMACRAMGIDGFSPKTMGANSTRS